jgi:hypothetical protein
MPIWTLPCGKSAPDMEKGVNFSRSGRFYTVWPE